MLLGFKRRFAPYVEDGSKTHTIRARRTPPPRVGETCHCYVDPRQKTMRLLGRFECVKVEEIRIAEGAEGGIERFRVWIDDQELTLDERSALAWRDGFRGFGEKRAFEEMMRYWVMGNPGNAPLRFTGHIIHWLYTQDWRAHRDRRVARSSAPKASGPATGRSRRSFQQPCGFFRPAAAPSVSSPLNAQPSAGAHGGLLGGTQKKAKRDSLNLARSATGRAARRSELMESEAGC